MYVNSADDLSMLSVDELNEVVSDESNSIELRSKARRLWRDLIDARPKADMEKTIVITPDLTRSIVDED
jgi:uncharacterized small protein (DUF1192 family)